MCSQSPLVVSISCAVLLLALSACAPTLPRQPGTEEHYGERMPLLNVATVIQDGWMELPLRGTTKYRITTVDGRVVIQATGRNAASGLIRLVQTDTARCPVISWSWRVDTLQKDADLRIKDKEDVAASIFLLFGDPGFLVNPDPVPTLRYVWTNKQFPIEAVIDNPYLPGVVRSVVIRSGEEHLGQWMTERRNVIDDFEIAFGQPPPDAIHAIVLFTDNDETKQPVEAYYEWIQAICR
jgi:hypothetical protein